MHLAKRASTPIALIATLLTLASTAMAAELVVTGTPGNDTITGTADAESIYGRAGDDTINGAGGDDELDGGPGADRLSGGEGTDSVAYSGAGVEVTIDGQANDGTPGEADNVGLDIEDLYGTDSDDKLTGSVGPNTIDGAAGSDRIAGGAGQDILFGGDGADTIDARDGEVDRIECGEGSDTVTVDLEDVVAADCESVAKPQVTLTPGLTLNGPKKKIIISTIVEKSSVLLICVTCKGKQEIAKSDAVKLQKGNVAVFKLTSKIQNQTIELGVRAPGASPVCVRYKVSKRKYKYTVDRKQACVSAAKGA